MLTNIGRSMLDNVTKSAASVSDSPEASPFAGILESKKIESAHTLQEILQTRPDIGHAKLLEIEQTLKMEIVSKHLNLTGDLKPLSVGEWSIQETFDSAHSMPTYTVTDNYGHSLKFRPQSAAYVHIELIRDIQDHLHHNKRLSPPPFASPANHSSSPAFTVPPFSRA
ncbi:MAG: hypothetical protein MK080_07895 [Opitutales bacterium]|nr:hypothetical protein [Opitutales bacterium]NRA26529.1 hypothetical protein [Opitutales bacterium]